MPTPKISHRQRRPLFDFPQSIPPVYLGWEQPILHSACDYLVDQFRRGESWDLSYCLVVLPGAYAGRRLATLLAQRAQAMSLILRPPEILTVGKLPEMLYSAKLPFATDLEQTLAWTKVLREADPEFLRPLLLELPDRNDVRPWIDLAKMLSALHRELSSDLIDFDDVAHEIADARELVRWEVLSKLQRRYLDELHIAGLWDLQTARRFAIDQKEVHTEKDIILIGAVDLNRAQRRFLDAVSSQVRVLIGAPIAFEGGFHSDGSLIPEFWQDLELPIDAEQVHVRSTPTDSAKELGVQLARLGGAYSVADVTIGIPDPAIVPILQETASDFGVALRYGPGESIALSPPMKLLETVLDYVASNGIEAFNRLVRIPSVEKWLGEQPLVSEHLPKGKGELGLLTGLDRYQEKSLIRTVAQLEWPDVQGKELFQSVVKCLDEWVQPLRVSSMPLEQWAAPIRSVIATAYSQMEIDPQDALGHRYLRSSQQINAILDEMQSIPNNLDVSVGLAEAYTWLVGQLESIQIPPLHAHNEIEMLGWLDLAHDDAPVLMLTGLQDGIVPESVNGDAFLPNQLRSQLGLMDNARRYARDCYALMTMRMTRKRFEILFHLLSVDGDPQTPSRLLLAVPVEQLADRVKWLLEPKLTPLELESAVAWKPRSGQTNIPIPFPVLESPIQDMAVTDFKKYDQCPYRFYLGRIQKAKAFEHEKLELDGGGFGDLIHKVVEELHGKQVAKSSDAEEIDAFLKIELERLAKVQFGVQRPPALIIQLEQAQRRLSEFAKKQAEWAAKGWEIRWIEHHVEKKDQVALDLRNGSRMIVHGRIDRIDYHPVEDRYTVWDYKTGDQTDLPMKNHMKGDAWIDWQLPLYGLLIQTLGIRDLSKVSFGYILLPKNPSETQFAIADFTVEQHRNALESAAEIAKKVAAGVFWPPKYKQIHPLDDYNAITQRSVARRWDKELAEKEEAVAASGDTQNEQGNETSDSSSVVDEDPLSEQSKPSQSPSKIELKPVIAQGIAPAEWFSPKMILASAGTGKTYNLASRALRLLFTEQSLDSILATTFTRKAAGEILHRVLIWLAKAVDSPEVLQQIQGVVAPLQIDRSAVIYQLGRLCSQLHRFRVSTLDSFYSQLARSFALELNLPPGWSLSDPFQYEQLKQEAITRMFETISHSDLRSLISQLSKGEATRSLRREIDSVVSTGYELFRRTSEDAWKNLQVPNAPDDDLVQNAIRAFRASEVKDARYPASRDKTVDWFEREEWGAFLSQTLVQRSSEDVPKFYRAELDPDIVSALRTLAKRAVSGELASRRAQNEAAYHLLKGFHEQLQWVKTKRRTVTFDDIAERLAHWMRGMVVGERGETNVEQDTPVEDPASPTMPTISYRMDCPIDHLLLDEFQDTSPVQWEIVKPFAETIVQNQVDRTSFFCVGDTKQAIYGWRGGVSEIFESVGVQIRNVQKEQLVKSFRSSQVVIDFVNDVFTQLDKHPDYGSDDGDGEASGTDAVTHWVSRNFTKHETAKTTLAGYVELRNANVESKRNHDADDSETNEFLEEVVDRISQLHRDAPEIEIGVLARTNQEIGSIIHLLRERGVEASQEGGNPLTDSAAVLLLQSAMRVANHPADTLAFFHVTQSPLAMHFHEEDRRDVNAMSARLRSWIDAFGFGDTVSQLAHTLAPQCNARDQDRLRQLVQLGYRFDALRVDSIYGFIEFIEQQRVALPGASKIRVMTIHQSKGLEFDAVFLPSLNQGMTARVPAFVAMLGDRTKPPIGVSRYISGPIQRYLDMPWKIAFQEYQQQQLAEALCLFYVALTRARQALYLYTMPSSSPKKRWGSVLQSIFAKQDQGKSPGVLLHSWGDAEWYQESHSKREVTEESELGDANEPREGTIRSDVMSTSKLSNGASHRIRLRGAKADERVISVLRPSQKEAADRILLGTQWRSYDPSGAIIGKLVHRWFEEITGWIEDFKVNKRRLKELAAASLTQEEMQQIRVAEWLDRFVLFCEMPGVRGVLSSSRYSSWHRPRLLRLEVSNERKLLQILDDSLLRGVIDRCVVGYDGDQVVRAEIIDFKTDQRPSGVELSNWIEDRKSIHFPQLALYRRAISDQYRLTEDQITMALVLLSEDQVIEV
ncbi:UvrD-helicase domain-containing protein [Pirellulaceae bacterium SH467]